MNRYWRIPLLISFLSVLALWVQAQGPDPEEYQTRSRAFSERMEAQGLAEDFRGITSNGEIVTGLYPIESSGVTTEPVYQAAARFIETLTPEQRDTILFPVDAVEWRKWANQHIYYRDGIAFEALSNSQRQAALAMLGESLSAKGLALTADIMRLNYTLGELNGDNFVEYGEGKNWITIMGTPSATEPWGWQLDGHHLNLNYFVLGD